MYNKNQGNSPFEVPFAGFVVEEIHCDQGTGRAAEDAEEKESCFFDPPFVMNGPVLIQAEKEEGEDIDDDPVIKHARVLSVDF